MSWFSIRHPPIIGGRAFATLKTIRLEHDGYVADVELTQLPEPGLPSGWRTWMKCPRCQGVAEVIGCVPVGFEPAQPGWACPKTTCGGWRGRPRAIVAAGDVAMVP